MCPKWLTWLLVGALALGSALQAGHTADTSAYEMPLVVRADGLRISDGVAAMARGTEVFLPVRELALVFEFPIRLDPERGRAEGWFLDASRRYVIDARQRRVQREGTSHHLPADAFLTDYLDDRRELYVKAAVLERAWPVGLTLSQADLALEVDPDEPLPIQQRRAREQRRERLRVRGEPERPDLPAQAHPYGWLRPPVVGLDLQAQSGGGPRATRQRLFWSQEVAGLNVAGGLFASGPSFSDSEVRDARLTVQRFAGNESLPGGLEWVAAGDVSGESLGRIGSVGSGRGVSLSSFPLSRGTAFDQHRLAGDAPPGWEAELYRDGRLMDFQQVGDDGRYRFDGIDLAYGLNRLQVILYGPQGQTRERIETVDVGQTQARPGATHLRLDHLEAGRDFVSVGDDDTQPDVEPGTSVRAVHGLSRRVSVEAGFIELPSDAARPPSRYALVGAAGALGPTATRVRVLGQEDGGTGLDVESRLRAGSVPLRLGLGLFDGFESPGVGFGDSALRGDFDLGVHAPLWIGDMRVRLGARYAFSETVSGQQRHRLDLSQRWHTGGIAWHHAVDYHLRGAGPGRWSASLDASDRWLLGPGSNLQWGAGLTYAQDVGVTGGRLRTRYRWSAATAFGLNVRHAAAEGRTTAGLDVTRRWDNARVSLTASGGEDVDERLGLRYSIGFGPRGGGGGGYTLAESQAPRRGSVAVHAFVDQDGDGSYDPGEPPVPEAQLARPMHRGTRTDDDGRMVMHDLEAHRSYPVRLDPASLINPFWLPADEGHEIRVRPGSVPVVELPVQETGAVSGTVRLASTDRETSGVTLRLVDASGETVARTRSIFGGFFSFEQIPYGRYEIVAGRGYALAGSPVSVAPDADDPMLSGLALAVNPRATTGHDIEGEVAADAPAQGADVHDLVVITGEIQVTSDEENRPVPGIRVRLLDERGQVIQQTRSRGDGRYFFLDVGTGDYRVHVADGEPSHQRVSIDGEREEVKVGAVVLASRQSTEIEPRAISGTVYVGGRSRPVDGQPIRLLDGRGQVIRQTRSDGAGNYELLAVPPGTYRMDVAGTRVLVVVRGHHDVLGLDVVLSHGAAVPAESRP